MVSIARKNLIEDVPRFLVAQAGIMFAVTLVTIQTGVLNGFLRSTVLLIENSEADLWVASEKLVQFEVTEPLVASQVESVRAVSGVEIAEPLILGSRRWYFDSGKSDPLRIVGFEPNGRLFNPGVVTAGDSARLSDPFTAMIDQSRQEGLEVNGLGHLGRIDTLPVEIIGFTEDSQSIVSSPFLFTSLANANAYISSGYKAELNCKVGSSQALECTRIFELAPTLEETQNLAPPNPLTSTDGITYILVKAAPQENLKTLAKRIESEIDGVRVLSQQELAGLNQNYWRTRTGIGWILGLGAGVGIVVGVVVVSQILYASVSDHIKEFGTLKAMGASDHLLYGVVIEQALWMAILGYIPGMALCYGASLWAASKGIIILITPLNAASALGLVVVMCVGSGLLAINKVTRLDPAIVFKA